MAYKCTWHGKQLTPNLPLTTASSWLASAGYRHCTEYLTDSRLGARDSKTFKSLMMAHNVEGTGAGAYSKQNYYSFIACLRANSKKRNN